MTVCGIVCEKRLSDHASFETQWLGDEDGWQVSWLVLILFFGSVFLSVVVSGLSLPPGVQFSRLFGTRLEEAALSLARELSGNPGTGAHLSRGRGADREAPRPQHWVSPKQ